MNFTCQPSWALAIRQSSSRLACGDSPGPDSWPPGVLRDSSANRGTTP